MWSLGVVVVPPALDDPACLSVAVEQMLIEAFLSQPAVKRLDKAVLHQLAGLNVVPPNTAFLLPFEHCIRCQLCAVVADNQTGGKASRHSTATEKQNYTREIS